MIVKVLICWERVEFDEMIVEVLKVQSLEKDKI